MVNVCFDLRLLNTNMQQKIKNQEHYLCIAAKMVEVLKSLISAWPTAFQQRIGTRANTYQAGLTSVYLAPFGICIWSHRHPKNSFVASEAKWRTVQGCQFNLFADRNFPTIIRRSVTVVVCLVRLPHIVEALCHPPDAISSSAPNILPIAATLHFSGISLLHR